MSDVQDQKLKKKQRLAQALRQNLGKRKIRNEDKITSIGKDEHPFHKGDAGPSVVK